jgi:hypothetical protein
MNAKLSALALTFALLAGCAATGPMGAVVPLAGGEHRSVVNAGDLADANKIFDNDAKLTCGSGGSFPGMSRPGKYVMVSQTAKTKEGKEIQTENKTVQAGIAVGLRYLGLEAKDAVTLETVFKCQ